MYRYHDRGVITTCLKHGAQLHLTGQYVNTRTLAASACQRTTIAHLPWSARKSDTLEIEDDHDGQDGSTPPDASAATRSQRKALKDFGGTSGLRLGFFSSNEKRFAALTRLPETFFRDVRSIRAIVRDDVVQATVDEEPVTELADGSTRVQDDTLVRRDLMSQAMLNTQAAKNSIVATSHQEALTLTSTLHAEGSDFLPYDQLWMRRRIANKLDLSHRHPASSRKAVKHDTLHETNNTISVDDYEDTFRANGGLRRTTKSLMKVVYPFLVSNDISRISDGELRSVIRATAHKQGHLTDQEVVDIFDYCYLLHMKSNRAICKYIRISMHRASNMLAPMPPFVLLQLLRADSSGFTAASLKFLVDHLFETVTHWAVDRSESIMILSVRLMRHARIVNPALLESIADITLRLMSIRFPATLDRNDQILRSTWCNTLMSLLALPATLSPMRSMIFQQRGQLSVLKYMQSARPNIPLDREGYRGMMRVQLAHRKTSQEREWATTKVLSWPPWQEQHQMGGRTTNELEGKVSRVAKVISHMTDEGYDMRQYDLAAQVLAGWDTDNSPTIQTRVSPMRLPLDGPWRPGAHHAKNDTAPLIWTARVLATRTLREAWMCFCDYTKTVPAEKRSADVYHAMFEKLHASTETYEDGGPLPGDGSESFTDSNLSRDLVYIPTPVPTQLELFDQLRTDGLSTTSRLLAFLLRNAKSATQVKHYLTCSHLPQAVVDALLDAGDSDEKTQHDLISAVPSQLLASVIYAFVQPFSRTKEKDVLEVQLKLSDTARYIMRKNFTRDHRVWNSYFQAWSSHVDRSRKDVARLSTYQLWPLVYRAVRTFQFRGINTTFFTLRAILPVAQNAALNYRIIDSGTEHPLPVIKQLFLKAAYGPDVQVAARMQWHKILRTAKTEALHSLPLGDDIEAMIWLLASPTNASHIEDVLALLYWLNRHQEEIVADTRRVSKHNLCAFRIVLEGLWLDRELRDMGVVKGLDHEQHKEYNLMKRKHAWPSDETILWYAERTGKGTFMTQLRNVWKHVHRRQESSLRTTDEGSQTTVKVEAEGQTLPSLRISRVHT